MTRRQAMIGGASTALIAAGIVSITAAALYVQQVNRGELALLKAPARAYSETLAAKVAAAKTVAARRTAAMDGLRALQRAAPTLKQVSVIVEPSSTKYRFLRKRRLLAHPDADRVGQTLDRRKPGDKQLYDVASLVRRDGAQLEIKTPIEGPVSVNAAAPVVIDGKHYATVVLSTEPAAAPLPLGAWPIGLGFLLCLLVGGVAGAVSPKQRHLVVIVATLGFAMACRAIVAWVGVAYSQQLTASIAVLNKALATSDSLPMSGIGLTSSWTPMAIAALFALLVGVAGRLGFGARAIAAVRVNRLAYTLLVPAGVGMLVLVFLPFGYGLGLGFFNHAHGTYTFVGLQNFVDILSGGGRPLSHPLNFYFTLGVTVLWTVVNVVLHVAIGLALALVLRDPLLGGKGIYRALLILPWAMPNYITALIWKGMFHYQYGAVNHVLTMLGLSKISWFASFSTAFTANVVTNTWLGFPFMMVVCLGALQSIPGDIYEAAAVDGASRWQAFWRVTMPLLRPALFPAIILGSIWTFNMFNIIYLVSAGAPGGSSDILITEAYRWAFERADRYGLAAAYALVIFVILFGYTMIANRVTRKLEEAQ